MNSLSEVAFLLPSFMSSHSPLSRSFSTGPIQRPSPGSRRIAQ